MWIQILYVMLQGRCQINSQTNNNSPYLKLNKQKTISLSKILLISKNKGILFLKNPIMSKHPRNILKFVYFIFF